MKADISVLHKLVKIKFLFINFYKIITIKSNIYFSILGPVQRVKTAISVI